MRKKRKCVPFDYDDGDVEFDEIFPLLGDAIRNGEWLMTWCPVHNDGAKHGRRPGRPGGRSLGLSERGVLRCFAGCDFADVIASLRGPEYEAKSGAPKKPKPPEDPGYNAAVERLADTYLYQNSDGHTVAEKARFEKLDGSGKRFMWRLPGVRGWPSSENGGGLRDIPLETIPLWGTEMVATAKADEWVIFTEGEKAAQACRERGLLAVTHGGGASTRRFGDVLEILKDRKVALWPDNDQPGRRYMTVIAQLLKNVARQVRYIAVPVPEKGDAYDFFLAGGKAEDIFNTIWDKPLVEFVAQDHIRVTTYTELGPVLFDADELAFGRNEKGIDTDLVVRLLTPGFEEEAYPARINLRSQSARETLERNLKKQFGADVNWTRAITQAVSRLDRGFTSQERGTPVYQILEGGALEFTLAPFFPRGQHSVVFGDGASMKTMLTYWFLLQIATGYSPVGYDVRPGNVLIVDYETSAGVAKQRLQRMLDAMIPGTRLEEVPGLHYWPAEGIPLAEQADTLRKYSKAHDIDVALIDSGGVACGGPPERTEFVIPYFAAAQKLHVESVITICHLAKQSDGSTPFGSQFWNNLARRTYHVKARGAGTDSVSVELTTRKQNEGRRLKPVGYQIDFEEGEAGPINITQKQAGSSGGYASDDGEDGDELNGETTIILTLRDAGAPLKAYEIHERTRLPLDTITHVLNMGANKGIFVQYSDGPGAVRRWGLATER